MPRTSPIRTRDEVLGDLDEARGLVEKRKKLYEAKIGELEVLENLVNQIPEDATFVVVQSGMPWAYVDQKGKTHKLET